VVWQGTSGSEERVTRAYLLRRLTKQGWQLERTDTREDGTLERDVLYGAGGARRYGGAQLTVHYEGEDTPQRCSVVGRDRSGWLNDEHALHASGTFMLALADSGIACR
jgi:hypothetical protein